MNPGFTNNNSYLTVKNSYKLVYKVVFSYTIRIHQAPYLSEYSSPNFFLIFEYLNEDKSEKIIIFTLRVSNPTGY